MNARRRVVPHIGLKCKKKFKNLVIGSKLQKYWVFFSIYVPLAAYIWFMFCHFCHFFEIFFDVSLMLWGLFLNVQESFLNYFWFFDLYADACIFSILSFHYRSTEMLLLCSTIKSVRETTFPGNRMRPTPVAMKWQIRSQIIVFCWLKTFLTSFYLQLHK